MKTGNAIRSTLFLLGTAWTLGPAAAIAAPIYPGTDTFLHTGDLVQEGLHRVTPAGRSYRPLFGTDADSSQAIGTFNTLVVPVAFSDRGFDSGDRSGDLDYWEDLVYGGVASDPYPFPSIRDYYLDQSLGLFELEGSVADVVELSETATYYATYVEGSSATGCYGIAEQLKSGGGVGADRGGATLIVQEVLEALLDQGVDLNDYVNNDDGVIDGLIIIHDGPGGENTAASVEGNGCEAAPGKNDIWSHVLERSVTAQSTEYTVRPLIGAEKFFLPNANRTLSSGIGVIAHEFGHVLGLPDLYDLSGVGYGAGDYTIMAYGLYDTDAQTYLDQGFGPDVRPKGMDPYLRHEMGWTDYKPVRETSCFARIYPSTETDAIWQFEAPDEGEYFLAEYRPATGWDADLPQSGVLLWHIDEFRLQQNATCIPSPESDCSISHYKVAVVQRDGNYDLEARENRGDAEDLYQPGDRVQYHTTSARNAGKLPGLAPWDENTTKQLMAPVAITDTHITSHMVADVSVLPPAPDGIYGQPPLSVGLNTTYSWTPEVDTAAEKRYSLLRAPAGMTIDTQTGAVHWVADKLGYHSFEILLQTCAGNASLATTFEVTADGEPTSPAGCGCEIGANTGPHWDAILGILLLAIAMRRMRRKNTSLLVRR